MFEFLLIIIGIFLIGNGLAEGIFEFIWNTAVLFANIVVFLFGLLGFWVIWVLLFG
ncbi:hypothetical protein OAM41_02905 [Gammaproteobacteria bacterium]|nr:hypothetical protein [Gammaproteobacteria bacterium]